MKWRTADDGGAGHLVDVDESLATGGRFRRESHVRQRVDDLRGKMQRVHQRVLRVARVDRHALDVHLCLVRREGLVDDLAKLRAVERVRDLGLEIAR